MVSNVTSRQTIRERLHSLLEAALTGVSNPVQVVYDHEPSESELEGQSPAVWIKAAGIQRDKIAEYNTKKINWANFFIHIAVSIDENDGLTPAQVEDKLDEIEKIISDVKFDNQIDSGYWEWIESPDLSTAGYVTIGKEYRTEIIIYQIRFRDE